MLFGTNTVYKITIKNGCIRPFLREALNTNTSYDSIPIDILCVSDSESSQKEYLCCFTGAILSLVLSVVLHYNSVKKYFDR